MAAAERGWGAATAIASGGIVPVATAIGTTDTVGMEGGAVACTGTSG
jgi:hypothetical protein